MLNIHINVTFDKGIGLFVSEIKYIFMMTFGGDNIDGNYGAYKCKLMMMMKLEEAMRNEMALQRANSI